MFMQQQYIFICAFMLLCIICLQVDKRRAIPCSGYDEWSGEHSEQKWGGEGQNRASRWLLFSYLVHCLESLQVSPKLL